MTSSVLDFAGRTVVVSGGASGIGAATARLAARLGADVVVWDLRGAADVARAIEADGCAARAVECDVTDRAAVEAAAEQVGSAYGVVTCAGICPLEDWMDDGFDALYDQTQAVNVKGSINLARAFLPAMERAGEGRIVMLGSVSGHTASASGVHYAASKGAVHSVVRWLAKQVAARNVLVNGVAPGPIATGMVAGRETDLATKIPLGRVGEPDEIAWPIMFLCSPMASFVTGSVLDANGGIFMA